MLQTVDVNKMDKQILYNQLYGDKPTEFIPQEIQEQTSSTNYVLTDDIPFSKEEFKEMMESVDNDDEIEATDLDGSVIHYINSLSLPHKGKSLSSATGSWMEQSMNELNELNKRREELKSIGDITVTTSGGFNITTDSSGNKSYEWQVPGAYKPVKSRRSGKQPDVNFEDFKIEAPSKIEEVVDTVSLTHESKKHTESLTKRFDRISKLSKQNNGK